MSNQLDDLIKKTKTIKERMRARAQKELKPVLLAAIKELKQEEPRLRAIRWTQYTPYFNDGDVCEFSMHAFDMKIDGVSETAPFYRLDGWYDCLDVADVTDKADVLQEFVEKVYDLAELVEAAFGDHAQVTIDVDEEEIEVEEYGDHD